MEKKKLQKVFAKNEIAVPTKNIFHLSQRERKKRVDDDVEVDAGKKGSMEKEKEGFLNGEKRRRRVEE